MIRTFLSAILLIGTFASTTHAEPQSTPDPSLVKEYANFRNGDMVMGAENAPITVIEYASLSCGHCADFYKSVFPTIKENYIETGKIRFIYRDFPLNAPALHAAQLARCSGEERYFDFIKVLFKTQESWAFKPNYAELLSNIAKLGGVSGAEFDQCMQNKTLEDQLLQSRKYASELFDITGTPSFVINGQTYKAMDADKFSKTLDNILANVTPDTE